MRIPALVDSPALLASVVAGGVAGILPDLLEPPVSPNHRGFYHSGAFLGLTIVGGVWTGKKIVDSEMSPIAKTFCICLLLIVVLGIASHVVLDWTTPAGFKLLG
jgi:membrane-bound metal-dependent hydrolase YbcI (DUF457 family)